MWDVYLMELTKIIFHPMQIWTYKWVYNNWLKTIETDDVWAKLGELRMDD